MRRALIVLALISMLLAMCASPAPIQAGGRPRVVVLSGVTGLGLARLLDDAVYDVEVGKSADVAVAKLTSGSADAAALPVSTAALLRNKGVPVLLAAITNNGSLYVLSRSATDLYAQAAKSLGVPGKGTMPDVTLAMLLKDKGISGGGVQYYSSPVELMNLLVAGRVEAALLPEPWVSQALQADRSLKVAADIQSEWRSLYGFDYPLSCVVFTESFVKSDPAGATRLLEDIKQSIEWVKSEPKKAAEAAAARLSMEEQPMAGSVPRCNLTFLDAQKAKVAALAFYEKVLATVPAMIGGKLPDEAFFHRF